MNLKYIIIIFIVLVFCISMLTRYEPKIDVVYENKRYYIFLWFYKYKGNEKYRTFIQILRL